MDIIIATILIILIAFIICACILASRCDSSDLRKDKKQF